MLTIFYFAVVGFLILKAKKIKDFFVHLWEFSQWKLVDMKRKKADERMGIQRFAEFGLKMYTGRQGSGKTISLVSRLNDLHKIYPKALIYTNFSYRYATGRITSLHDLLTIRNGDDGVIFAFDEIQNEFSSAASKDFPEELLGTITMQRKQHIVILSTSQVFTRVAKPLREQCYEVIECKTYFQRWTRQKCYDADDYNDMIEQKDAKKRFKTPKKWKRSFIQDDFTRGCYDTMEVVGRLSRQGFAPRMRTY